MDREIELIKKEYEEKMKKKKEKEKEKEKEKKSKDDGEEGKKGTDTNNDVDDEKAAKEKDAKVGNLPSSSRHLLLTVVRSKQSLAKTLQ